MKQLLIDMETYTDELQAERGQGYQEACRDILSLLNGDIDIEAELRDAINEEYGEDYKALLYFVFKRVFGRTDKDLKELVEK